MAQRNMKDKIRNIHREHSPGRNQKLNPLSAQREPQQGGETQQGRTQSNQHLGGRVEGMPPIKLLGS